ncbi:cobalt-precorrin-6A reductase [Salinifilum aidingensis]
MAAVRVLLLGGTGEAKQLAHLLDEHDSFHVVSSMAGRVRDPQLPAGEVRIGGFHGAEGLAGWLRDNAIDAVVDATHPFAAKMSASAAQATRETGVAAVVLRRPGWRQRRGDVWHRTPTLDGAAQLLRGLGRRVLLTTGRRSIGAFAGLDAHHFVLRCVDPPEPPVPAHLEVVLDRGPYTVEQEHSLLRSHRVDVLVTKDSGGSMTSAKLTACRELGVPVVLVQRPPVPSGLASAETPEAALEWLRARFG